MARAKSCKACGSKFEPVRSTQVICFSLPCAIQHTANLKAKRERKETRERKAKLKTRRDWLRDTQAVVNRYVRIRDAGKPCISCGTTRNVQIHAGHYRTTKAAPELRFHEWNINSQCAQCNLFDSGNLIEYRIGLIEKIGLEAVEWLEGPHEPKHYTVDDLKAIKADYARKTKELEKA